MKKPFGQPGRLEMEYVYTASIHNELHKVLEKDIQKIVDHARSQKIHIIPTKQQKTTARFTFLRFQSTTESHFPELRQRIEESTACTRFTSDHIHLLFSFTGNEKLDKFQFKRYLFTSYHSQSIWIYGPNELRPKIVTELDALVEKIKSFEVLDRPIALNKKVINVTKSGQDRDNVLKLCSRVKTLELCRLVGAKLYVSGSNDSVKSLETLLAEKKFLFTPFASRLREGLKKECGICFTPPDGKYMLTTSCKKECDGIFCVECIQPMFDLKPTPFPLQCPTCESPLVINDIQKWASTGSLRKVMEVAVRDYKEKNSNRILSCPKPGCDQLLAVESIVKGTF
jgi:hypothetical protein